MVFLSKDLEEATCNYSADKVIGEGSFGKVYKARLRYSDVAVKVLSSVRSYTLFIRLE